MSTRLTKRLARQLAARMREFSRYSWDALRDELDILTAGDLDSWQLDTLTDWVEEELR